MRMLSKLPSLANVAPGSTATLNCPIGRSYDRIILEYTGVTLAQMKNLRVELDGKPIQEFKDAVQLNDLNKYYGRFEAAGFITIWFNRPEMNTLEHQRVTRLGTGAGGQGVVQTFQISFDVDSAATAPVVRAHAVQSEASPLGMITKVKQFVFSSATAGQFEIDSIPRGPRILAVHCFKSDVTAVEVEQNSRKIREGSKELLEFLQQESGRAPMTAKATTIDFTQEADLYHSLETRPDFIRDQRFRLSLATPGEVRVVVEYLDHLPGI
ncbi:MAG: hypothetical protein IBX50_13945 [Marinospirillum sp.]|uniref:major capsid protein P2 n=1 Tax=Marinospirillum sp. TaxID=2183934 RepID=UPI0019F17E87|nr:major capsid protein P2 [Marinospirillum sp.]MBE0507789.1 hypothetical protein [Marinospirillum sp.]